MMLLLHLSWSRIKKKYMTEMAISKKKFNGIIKYSRNEEKIQFEKSHAIFNTSDELKIGIAYQATDIWLHRNGKLRLTENCPHFSINRNWVIDFKRAFANESIWIYILYLNCSCHSLQIDDFVLMNRTNFQPIGSVFFIFILNKCGKNVFYKKNVLKTNFSIKSSIIYAFDLVEIHKIVMSEFPLFIAKILSTV